MTDKIDMISIFVAVAELGSFAEAGRRLNRTPASVTRAVAALESDLRTRLLNRTTRSVALTDAGHRYLEVGRRLLGAYDELKGLESEHDVEPHGKLHVTAPAMFGRLHVLPSITRFLHRFPLIDVRAILLDRVVSLIDEGLDLGIRLGHLPDSSLRAVRVGQVHLGVYASPAYIAAHGVPATPHDLVRHQTISCLAITPIPDRWSFEGARNVETVPVKPRLVVDTSDAAADAAADGLGLTFLVSYQAESHLAGGRLVRVLQGYEPPEVPIHIIHPAGRFVPAKVRLLIDHIAEDLRAKFAKSHPASNGTAGP